MRLWRLSTLQFADAFDGGYGLRFDGRWNTVGRPVTYAATSPSLCVLEKLVHVEAPALLPSRAMVSFEVPDEVPFARRVVEEPPVAGDTGKLKRSDSATSGWPGSTPRSCSFPRRSSPSPTVRIRTRSSTTATLRLAKSRSSASRLSNRMFGCCSPRPVEACPGCDPRQAAQCATKLDAPALRP